MGFAFRMWGLKGWDLTFIRIVDLRFMAGGFAWDSELKDL